MAPHHGSRRQRSCPDIRLPILMETIRLQRPNLHVVHWKRTLPLHASLCIMESFARRRVQICSYAKPRERDLKASEASVLRTWCCLGRLKFVRKNSYFQLQSPLSAAARTSSTTSSVSVGSAKALNLQLAYLTAGMVFAVAPVHLGAAVVERVDQLMRERAVHPLLILDVVLAQHNLRSGSQRHQSPHDRCS